MRIAGLQEIDGKVSTEFGDMHFSACPLRLRYPANIAKYGSASFSARA